VAHYRVYPQWSGYRELKPISLGFSPSFLSFTTGYLELSYLKSPPFLMSDVLWSKILFLVWNWSDYNVD